ncbi:MAG: cyclic pyranopterin monophosphate synthase MoaC [Oscillospiraceae bacterium]|jgi:cyclic pyranopterin phosphate synthase|nr:cyclic pyranopterin monophosphate synthase MoaC [Oscillospiraceae bacterium]
MHTEFTHFNASGEAHMVDVSDKAHTLREAVAFGQVRVNPATYEKISGGGIKKGDVLSIARIAGIMGAKRVPDLIPLCHSVIISGVEVSLALGDNTVDITAAVTCTGQTGVEMEALTAVTVAALTVYDMCKAVQRDISIENVHLLKKSGGKSGTYEHTKS